MRNKHCFTCGGEGFRDRVCPECGLDLTGSFNFDQRETTEDFVEKISIFGVPSQYRGIAWSAEQLKKYKIELNDNAMFEKYCSQLDKVHKVFASRMIPQKSVIISAPVGFSKTTFMYSCIQHALDAGFTVAPVLDTNDVKRLLVLGADRPTYKLFNQIDYDTYLMCEVCFITVTKLPQHEYCYPIINELISKRARTGLSTIVLSDYDVKELCRKDTSNQFEALDSVHNNDWFKYPAIISFNPRYGNVLKSDTFA